MPILSLRGPGALRGRMHGESLRAQIQELIGVLMESVGRMHGVAPAKVVSEFLKETGHVDCVRQAAPDLYDEVIGIAEGANCAVDEIWAHNLIDELWCFGFKDRASLWDGPFNKCSVIGIPGDGVRPAVAGQNIDVSSWYDGYQVLLRVHGYADDAGALVISIAGMIGLAGIGECGVGLCINALFELEHSSAGLPVSVLVRSTLARRSLEEAKRHLRDARHSSGQHYLLCDREHVISLECSANRIEIARQPTPHFPVCHTNHVLLNPDTAGFEELVAGLSNEKREDFLAGSRARLCALEDQLADAGGRYSIDLIKRVLASTSDNRFPVSRDGRHDEGVSWMTLASIVFEFQRGGPARLHVAAGPPHVSEYMPFELCGDAQAGEADAG